MALVSRIIVGLVCEVCAPVALARRARPYMLSRKLRPGTSRQFYTKRDGVGIGAGGVVMRCEQRPTTIEASSWLDVARFRSGW